MKQLSILLIIGLSACQSKTETSTVKTDSTSDYPAYTVDNYTKEESTIEYKGDFNYLILPPAEVYPDSAVVSGALPDIYRITPTICIAQTSKMHSYTSLEDICNGFPLYKFRFSSDSVGWVHGSQVFQVIDDVSATFMYQSIPYELHLAVSTGVGTATEVGTTGCKEYQLPYLIDKRNNLIHLISANSKLKDLNLLGNTDQQWFGYVSDEGMSVSIKSATISNDEIVIDHFIDYQEGSRAATMVLKKEGANFVIYRIDAENRK